MNSGAVRDFATWITYNAHYIPMSISVKLIFIILKHGSPFVQCGSLHASINSNSQFRYINVFR